MIASDQVATIAALVGNLDDIRRRVLSEAALELAGNEARELFRICCSFAAPARAACLLLAAGFGQDAAPVRTLQILHRGEESLGSDLNGLRRTLHRTGGQPLMRSLRRARRMG